MSKRHGVHSGMLFHWPDWGTRRVLNRAGNDAWDTVAVQYTPTHPRAKRGWVSVINTDLKVSAADIRASREEAGAIARRAEAKAGWDPKP